ncbi:M48 family peptidase [Georhizobium profundi]|jgi:predicted metal-dependent hydrolase|uniref:M48 family peptidase n=1 Tax=Georhizobium profundi TaxID=2341112 RepID=A0A3Q8XLF2_9HYPH|nr:SprT family zinc-dependent metalloprotease [Georhizobium profundi]AZN70280.1 M48 family peptidase [Georhizobium profundi]
MFKALSPLLRGRKPKPRQALREVRVHDRVLPLVIAEHGRSTRLTLRIEPGGRGLKVTVPPGVPASEIDRFIERQQGWLMTRLARYPAGSSIVDGGQISLRGVDHVIRATGKVRGRTASVVENGRAFLDVGGEPEHLSRRIRDFLKKEARQDLTDAVARHAGTLKKRPGRITIKDTRSRWGSCTSDGNLAFSWRIVMAPPHVIDYLAAHEVAHLAEMNHGPQFWSTCRALCAETDAARAWLKRHGTLLHAVDFGA